MLRARCLRLLKEKIEVKMRYKVALFLWPPYKELAMLHPDEISEVCITSLFVEPRVGRTYLIVPRSN